MARLSETDKKQRVLVFLNALQDKGIAEKLASYGFGQQDLDDGWSFLSAAVGTKFSAPAPVPAEVPADLVALDAWENHWYPIIDATLENNFPAVHATVMLNLNQTTGPLLIPSVETLVGRIEALSDNDATDEEKAAAAKLVQRGLTAKTLGEAKERIAHLKTIDLGARTLEQQAIDAQAAADREAAEAKMWGYYKEWSTVARAAITSKKQLKKLGLLDDSKKKKTKAEAEKEEKED